MANTGFGADFPVPNARQYPLHAVYELGVNPADATAGAVIKLPPGAQITNGLVNVLATGGASIVATDNQGTPVSLFGTVVTTAVGHTGIAAYPFYPSGAILTITPTAASAIVDIEYVVVGRENEQYLA